MTKAMALAIGVKMVFKVVSIEQGTAIEKIAYLARAFFGSRNIKFTHHPKHHFGTAFA